MSEKKTDEEIEKIAQDPFAHYAVPMKVLDDDSLDDAAKLKILYSMELEVREKLVATEENMPSGPVDCDLNDVRSAIRQIDGDFNPLDDAAGKQ